MFLPLYFQCSVVRFCFNSQRNVFDDLWLVPAPSVQQRLLQWHPTCPWPLSPGAGLWLVLWGERLVPHTTAHVLHPSMCSPPPWPLLFRVCNSFQFCTLGIYSPSWWWAEDLTCSPFRLPCVKEQPLSCLHILLSVSVRLCALPDHLLEIPGNIFLPLIFLLEAACALPWCPLHLSFWLFPDFSSLNRLPRIRFSVLGLLFFVLIFSQLKYSSDLGFNFGWT